MTRNRTRYKIVRGVVILASVRTMRKGFLALARHPGYECQGYCADGREDCEKPECPLYPFSQFNPNRSKRSTN